MTVTLSYLLCIFSSLLLLTNGSEVICVSSSLETLPNNNSCSSRCASRACKFSDLNNLQAAIKNEIDAVIICLCSSSYRLKVALNFTNAKGVSIIGVDGISTIDCQNDNNSGFYFINVNSTMFKNVLLNQCGVSASKGKDYVPNLTSSLYMENCYNIKLTNVSIHNGIGTGVYMANCRGFINITNSVFHNNNNHSNKNLNVGGGICIQSNEIASYIIQECKFTSNSARRGGGISALFTDQSQNIGLLIDKCKFIANSADFGGAISFNFEHYLHNITIKLVESNFESNHATAGGAINNYIFSSPHYGNERGISLLMNSCSFTSNRATSGGGIHLYHYYLANNNFTFVNCTWMSNSASCGSAVSAKLVTGESKRPVLTIDNCNFSNNTNGKDHCTENGCGSIQALKFQINITGNVKLVNNLDSALSLKESILEVKEKSKLTFQNNKGFYGGAIRMQGNSNIVIHDDAVVTFDSNSACFFGGAIYMDAGKYQNCFIQYSNDTQPSGSVPLLNFINNTVKNGRNGTGMSIFLSTIHPCINLTKEPLKALKSIANFVFLYYNQSSNNNIISTFVTEILTDKNSVMDIIPGKRTPIIFLDETNSQVQKYFRVTITKNVSQFVTMDQDYSLSGHMDVILRGKPESKAILTFIPESNVHNVTLHVILQQCPPGYILNEKNVCQCSAGTISQFLGIKHCNSTLFQAILAPGRWAGYVSTNESDKYFVTSNCPLSYCKERRDNVLLPEKTSPGDRELNDLVCSVNRRGRVCGECKENSSVYFHTQDTYDCQEDSHCNYGILLYIVSEIIPVTLLFLVIILFDVQLTTGVLNSFLFYSQMFSILPISTNSFIALTGLANTLLQSLKLVLSIFNLDFFVHQRLSFCLFSGATFLQMTAFSYVTVFYSLMLVLLTIIILNSRFIWIFQRIKKRKRNFSKSIIHGLSGFLVICYARYTKASFRILTPTKLYGEGGKEIDIVHYFSGNIKFISSRHLPYAIPALLIVITMTLPPPLVLIFFPLYYKFLSLFQLEESKFAKILCKVLPLEKLMPFFDSFQGSFKDGHRYFAGLYFAYKLCALLLYSTTFSPSSFFSYLQFQLTSTLAFHAWTQPYKNKWHNRLDIYILTILCIINIISMYNNQHTRDPISGESRIRLLSLLQALVAFTPLLIMFAYLAFNLWPVASKWCFKKFSCRKTLETESELTLSMIDHSRDFDKYSRDFDKNSRNFN